MEAREAMILVVEDDADAADALRTVLESEGYEVAVVESPAKAWEALRAAPADLVLLDVMMPSGTEGFHFVWDLRNAKEQALRELPVIIISAIHDTTPLRFYPTEGDDTYGAGEYLPVQAFLDKPVKSQDLLAQVQVALKGKAAQE